MATVKYIYVVTSPIDTTFDVFDFTIDARVPGVQHRNIVAVYDDNSTYFTSVFPKSVLAGNPSDSKLAWVVTDSYDAFLKNGMENNQFSEGIRDGMLAGEISGRDWSRSINYSMVASKSNLRLQDNANTIIELAK